MTVVSVRGLRKNFTVKTKRPGLVHHYPGDGGILRRAASLRIGQRATRQPVITPRYQTATTPPSTILPSNLSTCAIKNADSRTSTDQYILFGDKLWEFSLIRYCPEIWVLR